MNPEMDPVSTRITFLGQRQIPQENRQNQPHVHHFRTLEPHKCSGL